MRCVVTGCETGYLKGSFRGDLKDHESEYYGGC